MTRCFQRGRRDCGRTHGLPCPGTKQRVDQLILSCCRPVLGALGYWQRPCPPSCRCQEYPPPTVVATESVPS